jgi:hypothetical protein
MFKSKIHCCCNKIQDLIYKGKRAIEIFLANTGGGSQQLPKFSYYTMVHVGCEILLLKKLMSPFCRYEDVAILILFMTAL